MGNCQAAEAAAVLIQHPGGGRTERAYWALSAGAVMAANPGHYVAAVIATTQPAAAAGGTPAVTVKHLKLLRPDDTLLLGRVYRLVSFEEVLREFASKRHVKLSRVTIRAKDDEEEEAKPVGTKHRRRRTSGDRRGGGERKESDRSLAKVMRQTEEPEPEPEPGQPSSGPSTPDHGDPADAAADLDAELEAALLPHGALLGRRAARQWRPALQSIAEG
ncbi:hypothetical protein GQ55_9G575500 [Panicum hallii var. hallii]|uniref:Uncharacterized protein n=1 Tax=Panicum hallii var. hallii TaxID=1504633 RepID=A0A2T7CG87_9POAL|nr:hypothetical protein GQ55_9G575500 [Panicum hallii var. hallii]